MAKATDLVILSDSKFVCDSLHLADLLWGGRHDLAMRDLSKMISVAKSEGDLLKCEEIYYIDRGGRTYKKFDLTQEDLSILCAYSEKLRPQFVKLIRSVGKSESKRIAQLEARAAQLEAEKQKSLPKGKVKNSEKRIKIRDEETRELKNVLAMSLDVLKLSQGIVDKTLVELAGKQAALDKKLEWNAAVGNFCAESCYGALPIPSKFNFRTEYDEIIRDKLEEAQELHELADY